VQTENSDLIVPWVMERREHGKGGGKRQSKTMQIHPYTNINLK